MCGIAGSVHLTAAGSPTLPQLAAMTAMLHHRGPESVSVYLDPRGRAGLAHARLSIVDLAGGLQPLTNEDGTVWIIVNGEFFNYVELADELRAKGHQLRTGSDSEMLVHLYEERGIEGALAALVGQFAFALWDERRGEIILGRDRLGVRPLFYTLVEGALLFGSEIKALLADSRVRAAPSAAALDQTFTYWAPLPGQTMFAGIAEVPAGTIMRAHVGSHALDVQRYWRVSFGARPQDTYQNADDAAEQLRALLLDATQLRLRADVPVGAYLSGGLDSSTIASLVRTYSSNPLQTFSVDFADANFDERIYSQQMASYLGTEHTSIECTAHDIAAVFPEVIWHSEVPLLRTSPAPLLLLAAVVHSTGLKVVLTGEGSDEFLGGYDIFKEALVRRFWAHDPKSRLRPRLLHALHGHAGAVRAASATAPAFLEGFYRQGLTDTGDLAYSHRPRWRTTSRLKALFAEPLRAQLAASGYDAETALFATIDPALAAFDPLGQAQYLESTLFLPQYLLSSQGDRMAMAHSVEGRFPFLDHRVVEFAAALPAHYKLRGLNEKWLLKRAFRDLLPEQIWRRTKQPYRAPIREAFAGVSAPSYVAELLAPERVASSGLLSTEGVLRLLRKAQSGTLGEMDEMALVAVLSTQLWHDTFVTRFAERRDAAWQRLVAGDDILCVSRNGVTRHNLNDTAHN